MRPSMRRGSISPCSMSTPAAAELTTSPGALDPSPTPPVLHIQDTLVLAATSSGAIGLVLILSQATYILGGEDWILLAVYIDPVRSEEETITKSSKSVDCLGATKPPFQLVEP
ncbi:hypothetical protein D9611_010683 [Ephemerocybe angulata]|uniref:Uncharacterized protein n=1 Tax=Ephemerocybe angulata TaxID=980116 RepID=A0A8H5BC83_9AGAR|nr:hypothetical protein D9611_010683 [Tulosesus angulatus]